MSLFRYRTTIYTFILPLFLIIIVSNAFAQGNDNQINSLNPSSDWWMWIIVLFIISFILGIIAVAAGVGGGVLFVPIVGSFFPFHIDFVRGAGLILALAGALSAGPPLLKNGLANLRLALPFGLVASVFSFLGANFGLEMLSPPDIQKILGFIILLVIVVMIVRKKDDLPEVKKQDTLGSFLGLSGIYHDLFLDKTIHWQIHRTLSGLILFAFIGFIAGMLGLGAGWANVPVLNLWLGVPFRVSVASSKFILSITDTSAAWVYANKGLILPIIAVPSIAGIVIGTKIGVKLLLKLKPQLLKWTVIIVLLFASLRALLKGFHIWN
ncbi:MAG: sulfite exporter TauE/SafE family protein [Spirochaetota bacterium]|nr:sulfite exporter TauE/SafE family protein [Spirochaetota bacterium]